MSAGVRALATDYVKAVGDRQFDRVVQLLHPDVVANGPRELKGRAELVSAIRRLAPVLVRSDIRRIMAESNEAIVIYDLVTDTPAGAIPCTEWLVLEDRVIRTMTLIVDGRRWSEVIQEVQRRAAARSGGH